MTSTERWRCVNNVGENIFAGDDLGLCGDHAGGFPMRIGAPSTVDDRFGVAQADATFYRHAFLLHGVCSASVCSFAARDGIFD